jgi:hypothetical protein
MDERMHESLTKSIREGYDRLADGYARKIFSELERKPLDRELVNRFAAKAAGQGEVCDMGCGPIMTLRFSASRYRSQGAQYFSRRAFRR